MVLLLREHEVLKILNFKDAYDALKNSFILLYQKLATNTKRVRTLFHGSVLTYQAGGLDHYLGFKVFIKGTFFSMLFDDSGEPLLLAESDLITRIRTGAISVLASDFLARSSYSVVGIIGLGKQGKYQVKAYYELKPGVKIKVFSKEKLEEEARKIIQEGIKVEKAKDYKDVCNADVIVTVTNSKDPFIKYEFLNKGTHINALGSNLPERVELYPEVLKNASIIAVEDLEQAKEEAGDLIMAEKMNMLDWNKVKPISEIIAGKVRRNSEDELTVFKSMGIGLEDVAILKLLYEKAKKYGIGSEIDIGGKWSLG
ncbi:TPA: ornithine cyclodeaminase family protein [Sulfurisphaera tokodaii]|uniref:Ornithine cyclodeaminase family protein n=1 Tax=Sulfurisphaera tokodaii TaxID=111955 RepID=A0A832WQN4_9CREN|nr:ornithine cyclodeaminase family protein [Sulfurisphaera tokodaii]